MADGVGRLKPGVGLEQARDQMARIAADLAREFPDDNKDHGLGVSPSARSRSTAARSCINSSACCSRSSAW